MTEQIKSPSLSPLFWLRALSTPTVSSVVARASHHRGCKKMKWSYNCLVNPVWKRKRIFPGDKSESLSLMETWSLWNCGSKTAFIRHSCQDTIVISRTILSLYLPCRGVGQDEGEGGSRYYAWCVAVCLGFHRPNYYRLIPGDSFLIQEILPSVRLTEVISLFQTTTAKERSTILVNLARVLQSKIITLTFK